MLNVEQRWSRNGTEIHQLAQLPQPLVGPLGIEAVQVGEEEQHLARREPLVQPGTRRDETHAAFDLVREFGRAQSLDLGVTARGRQQAQNHADGRRLAGAVGPEQAVNFARADAKREMIDRDDLALMVGERLGQFVDGDHLSSSNWSQVVKLAARSTRVLAR